MNARPSVLRHALSTPSSTRLLPHPRRLEKTRASVGALRRLHDEPKAQKHLDWPLHVNPTPYEILHHSPRAAYSKQNFYTLAKLYHPDRHHCLATTHSHLSPSACVERYRLVVRANDILSDPAKRRAYDSYGAGWHGTRPTTSAMYREWRSAQHSPAKNATWEDWEQWRDERDGKKQAPVYMSHGAFAVLLTFAISIGIIGQANRAGKMASNRMDLMQEKQGRLGAVMDKRSSKTAAMGREERVESFIRDRENALWGYAPEKLETPHPGTR